MSEVDMNNVLYDPDEGRERLPFIMDEHSEAEAQQIALWILRQQAAPFRPPFRPVQMEMYKAIWNATPEDRIFFVECSRRLGKTYLLLSIAIIFSNMFVGRWVRYGGPTYEQLNEMILPPFQHLLKYIAEPYRPQLIKNRYFLFPNNSRITFGSADRPDSLRGPEADLVIVDECGYVRDLKYLLDDIFLPMLQGKPHMQEGFAGKCLCSTTPPPEPAHYANELAIIKEAEGNYIRRTIYDRQDLPEFEIQSLIKRHGGEESPTFQREYLARRAIDETVSVLKEFHDHVEEIIVDDYKRPPIYDAYSIGDLGFSRDLTAVLVGFYDYENAKLIVEDEIVGYGITSKKVAVETKKLEVKNNLEEFIYKRGLETPERTIQDINSIDYLELKLPRSQNTSSIQVGYFSQIKVPPGSFEARLNKLKQWIIDGRIRINKRCTQTIAHCKAAVWNKQRTNWKRSDKFGHFDALAALMYMVDSINQTRNPTPDYYGKSRESWFIRPEPKKKTIVAPSIAEISKFNSLNSGFNKIQSDIYDELDF